MKRQLTLMAVTLMTGACATSPGQLPAPAATLADTPHRVYDVAAGEFVAFEDVVARAAGADVVFFGEQHGLAPGHRMQLALLRGLALEADRVRDAGGADAVGGADGAAGATLSLEMFERDVAALVDAYAAGGVSLDALLAEGRPWPAYATDYRPQVDLARARGWRVVAANVPRELASLVAREGLAGLDDLPVDQRAWAAAELDCPDDAYRTRFIETIRQHPMGPPGTPEEEAAREQRYYESQCVKDETMAEAIAAVLREGAARPVVHLTGAFHSDHGDGIPARLLRRVPSADIVSVTVVPVVDLRALDVSADAERADYLLYVSTG